jgi:hypothetical protein
MATRKVAAVALAILAPSLYRLAEVLMARKYSQNERVSTILSGTSASWPGLFGVEWQLMARSET